MSHDRQVYLLDPLKLPPETIAVTFAKTSRSPQSFRQIAAELTEARSAEFNEKWVVGYGHSSVAEHAVLHLAVENISRLAVETLQSNRLASYTEKSTRYQTWEPDAFYIPSEFAQTDLEKRYVQVCRQLFSMYQTCMDRSFAFLEDHESPIANESKALREHRLRSQAVDACRFLLPASALANVGMTINARALEHAIGKMLSHPLAEVQQIGMEIKTAATSSVPTLLKYAQEIPYMQKVSACFASPTLSPQSPVSDWCELVHYDHDGLDKVLAAALYREQKNGYAQCMEWVRSLSSSDRQNLLRSLLADVDAHTIPARELEALTFTFDLTIDQGAYYEVKRHRMMTQTPQHLTANLGYATPRLITDAGVQPEYDSAMQAARACYHQLAQVHPQAAAYIVPNGFNRRLLLTLNLRSAMHFIRLRSASNAHFSVRRVAQRMAEQLSTVFPELEPFPGRNVTESALTVECNFFSSTCS